MLWYTKGEARYRLNDISDFIESTPPDKQKHKWAQSQTEARYIIENLTLDGNALVVDPFLGSGSFILAAAKLGRFAVGIEIDKDTFTRARINIAEGLQM